MILVRALVGSLLALLAVSPPAFAHRPYERLERVITSPSGARISLVLSYVDGIMLSDPVKLVVRDAQGKTLAETGYVTDVSLLCPSSGRCFAFLFDGSPIIVPRQVYRVVDTGLLEAKEWWLLPLGVVAHVTYHWVGYSLVLLCIFVPVVVLRRTCRAPRQGLLRTIGLVAGFPAGVLLYGLCLWGLLMSELSLSIGALIVLGVASCEAVYSFARPPVS